MYGSADGVAALSNMWTANGSWTTATRPTLAQVTTWLDQVSSLVDTALADEGFTVPVVVPAVVKEIDLLVESLVKDLADFSHSTGRFYTDRVLQTGYSPFVVLDKEIHTWVQMKSVGFENQGVPKVATGRKVASFDLL